MSIDLWGYDLHTAGANGDLPEGLHFQAHDGWTHAYDHDTLIGYLRPHQGRIDMIKVHPDYRRRGIGTAMLDWHRANVDPHIQHSADQTPLGRAWGKSVGWEPETWNRQDPDNDTLEDYEVERPDHTAHRTAMPWYHSTDAELNPGDMLLPAAERGHPSKWTQADGYDPHSVYFNQWDTDDEADDWFGSHRYEVEPVGPVSRDPEFEHNKQSHWDDVDWENGGVYDEEEVPGYNSYVAPRARVVRKLNQKARIMTAAVTVYTKPSCPQCDMTHKLLNKLGIEHTTVDVTSDPQAHEYVTGLGYQSAPVVVVGDGEDHWSGFKVDRLKGLAG